MLPSITSSTRYVSERSTLDLCDVEVTDTDDPAEYSSHTECASVRRPMINSLIVRKVRLFILVVYTKCLFRLETRDSSSKK